MKRRHRVYLMIPLLFLVPAFALGGPIDLHGGTTLESSDPSADPIVIAKAKSNHTNRGECTSACDKAGQEADLTWDVACADYCRCLWETDNSAEQCKEEFTDATGKDPPFRVRLQPKIQPREPVVR